MLLEKGKKRRDKGQKPTVGTEYCHQVKSFFYKTKVKFTCKGSYFGHQTISTSIGAKEAKPWCLVLNQNQVQRNPVDHRDRIVPVCPDSLRLVPATQKLLTCWHKSEGISEKAMLPPTLLPNCSNLFLHCATEFAWFFDCQILRLPCC